MRKRLVVPVILIVLLAGCGNTAIPVDENISESTETSGVPDNEEIAENGDEAEANDELEAEETGVLTNLDAVGDADETSLNLKAYKYSFEDRNVESDGDSVFYLADFKDDSNYLHLADSISLYAFNGKCVGHTKEGIDITTIGRYDDWYYLMLDRNYRFVKVADVEAVASNVFRNDVSPDIALRETATAPVQNNNAVETSPVSKTPDSVPDISEEAPAQTDDKYTPEEAIAVWSGILNENGMIYEPSIKEFASWGTGIIYLNKGMPEEIAQQDLLGYAYGDGGGHSFNRYYYEVTDSDDGAVYITAWCCP